MNSDFALIILPTILIIGLLAFLMFPIPVWLFWRILYFLRRAFLLCVAATLISLFGMLVLTREDLIKLWLWFYAINGLFLAIVFTLKAFNWWDRFKYWIING